jgi:hypothetical protein
VKPVTAEVQAGTVTLAELSRFVPVKQEPFMGGKPGFIPSLVLCCSVVYPNPMHRGSSALQMNAETQFSHTALGYRLGRFFLDTVRIPSNLKKEIPVND